MNKKNAVVAKLLCTKKIPTVGHETVDIDFWPADEVFASSVSLYGMSKQAAVNFEIGKEYYLTLMPIEAITKVRPIKS